MTQEELEEFEELRYYIELCSMGDRPMSPSAAKLDRYFELKDKLYQEECAHSGFSSYKNL